MPQKQQDEFEFAFKRWASQPPDTPPETAAARLIGQLSERKPEHHWAWPRARLAVAAIVLVMLAAIGWIAVQEDPASSVAAEVGLPTLEGHVLLLWLDEATPLYLTVTQPTTKGDS